MAYITVILGSIKTKWLSKIRFHFRLDSFSVILKFVQNLLLRTSPRFFARSEPNHCRNVLWKVNINNYLKKLKFQLTFAKGRKNFRKRRGQFYLNSYTSWTEWDIFPKLRTRVHDIRFWSNKKNYADLPLGGAIILENVTRKPLVRSTWNLVYSISVQRGTKYYNDICISQKTWPPLAKQI